MAYQTILPRALREEGLTVETVPGWERRGYSSFNPGGAVCHWTAGPRNATGRPCLNLVVYGRSDLPGPLCNVYLDRQGIAVVVAAGRANHAGSGGWKGLTGNSSVFGTEAECGGDGDWTVAQRISYPKVNAAFAKIGGFGADKVCGHSEWTSRKVDIRDWPMSKMREDVATLLKGGTITPIVEKEDEMKNLKIVRNAADGRIYVGNGVIRRHITDPNELSAVQYVIALEGGDSTIHTWGDIRVLGALVPF